MHGGVFSFSFLLIFSLFCFGRGELIHQCGRCCRILKIKGSRVNEEKVRDSFLLR